MDARIKAVNIRGRRVGPGEPVFIIAEAGVNHNGDLARARQIVDAAVEVGADAIKFQTFRADDVVSRAAPKAAYQVHTTDPTETQRDMLKGLELSADAHRALSSHCAERGILFLSTPFSAGGADLLDGLGVPVFKISSGDVTNLPLLDHVGRKRKPVLLSTGMAYLSEVDEAVRALRGAGCQELILLQCVSNYPADPADANLRTIPAMAQAFEVPVGYSDHTPGVETALAAVALGACVIEKHVTLDRNLPGPDHRASLEPPELRALVSGIRMVERALGEGTKHPAPSEMENREVVRRSLAAARDIPNGAILTMDMLTAVRPGTGISPALRALVLGRRVARSLAPGTLLSWGDLL